MDSEDHLIYHMILKHLLFIFSRQNLDSLKTTPIIIIIIYSYFKSQHFYKFALTPVNINENSMVSDIFKIKVAAVLKLGR